MTNPWDVFPEPFLAKLDEFPAIRRTKILQGLSVRKPTTFRVNTLKSSNVEVLGELTADGWTVEAVPWNPHAFIVRKYGVTRIAAMDVFTQGKVYLQSLASMLPALILDPKEGESVLDACAAPGSKTTQLAALMKNTGKILANDISPIRLEKLKANLRIQGATNVSISQMPAQMLSDKFNGQFDAVLIDVPCTMEGRFDATNPKSYRNWAETYATAFPTRQIEILRAAIKCAKPGGKIVYSTCTISQDENEGVIKKILEEGNVKSLPVEIPGFSFDSPGRVDPTSDLEGFFVAKLQKTIGIQE